MAAKLSAAGPHCDSLSEAGENGTGTLSRVAGVGCMARVIENAYTTFKVSATSPESP